MKRKKEVKTGRQVKVVKISTTLYSINHCQKYFFPKQPKLFGLW